MPRRSARKRIAKGIYEDAAGRSAVVRVGSGPRALYREKRYPRDTPIKMMRPWQDETRRELKKQVETLSRSTLREDVPRYIARVQEELASIKDRERDIDSWLGRFGDRVRQSLRTAELDEQLQHWRNVDGLAASTVNHRRDALSDLFSVLDGKDARNPVKGCVWFERPPRVAKGISRRRIESVLLAMDDDTQTKWRLLMIHWTGMRPSQLGRLTEDHFLLDDPQPAVLIPSGKGGNQVMMPLLAEGLAAARGLLRTGGYGAKWSCPSANKMIAETAARVGVAPFTVYTIKHSFATGLRRAGTDLNDIRDMLGHQDIRTTEIYAPAVSEKHLAALERLRQADRRQYDQQLMLAELFTPAPTAQSGGSVGTIGRHARLAKSGT